MKVLVILGVALLCLTQAYGEGDILKSLFEEKVQHLSRERRAASGDDFPCDANDLVANGSQIIKNTLDIVQKTFAVTYTLVYPNSDNCDLAPWRCYIAKFVNTKDDINTITTNLREYRDKSSNLIDNIKNYFSHCAGKK